MQDKVYFQFMDQAQEIVLVFDEQGKVVFANRMFYKLLEYEEDVQSLLVSEVFPGVFSYDRGRVVFEQGKVDMGEQMAYRKNRTCFAVNMRLFPVAGEEGRTAIMAMDTTVQNYLAHRATLADEQMENAEQIKTQFVANVTHELRTPANGILGNVRELMKIEDSPEKMAFLRLIERGCNDMHAIINNVLDFSKLDAGKLELEQKEFVFRDLMDYIRASHQPKITEKGLEFVMNISPNIPETVVGDELRIGQILNNFLSNATKFTSTGKIMVKAVKTAQMGDRIELFFMVMDTGIGIDKEAQDKLFKSFSQVEASTTRKYGGTGLGLNISKQLVEMMGGNVHVESEKNKGSVFSFHIWVQDPSADASQDDGQIHSYAVEKEDLPNWEGENLLNQYGTEENRTEIQKKLSKLTLCVEMGNWEKAEMFMDAIKQLTQSAPQPVKTTSLRLKMSVQKADYEKTQAALTAFKAAVEEGGQ